MSRQGLRARARVRFFALVVPLFTTLAQVEPEPDASAQRQILLQMRESAATWRMPDAAFDLRMTHFRASPIGSDNWQPEWSIEEKRIAHDGHVYLCCAIRKKGTWRIAPTPPNGGKQVWAETWYVPGFSVFPWDGSPATIVWDHWDTLRRHRVAVFRYSVARENSHWIASGFPVKSKIPHSPEGVPYSGPVQVLHEPITIAYTGTIWVDPQTGEIWRWSNEETQLPLNLRTRYASEVVDYDRVTLGNRDYLLPVIRIEIANTDTGRIRLVWNYSNYQRFEADSTITFLSVESSITFKH